MRNVFFGLIVLSYFYQLLFSHSGALRYSEIAERIDDFDETIAQLKQQNHFLRRQIHLMKKDPLTIEYAIRETYGYLKPGEIVVEITKGKIKEDSQLSKL